MRTINVTIAAQSDDSQNLMIFFVLYPFAFLSIHFIRLILFELKNNFSKESVKFLFL